MSHEPVTPDSILDSLRGQSRRAENDRCPSAEQLAEVAAGAAGPATRRAIVEHLGRCRACSEDYRLALELREWASTAVKDAPLTRSRSWTAWLWAPIRVPAGALAATVVVLGLWLLTSRLGPSPSLPVEKPPAAQATEKAPAVGNLQRNVPPLPPSFTSTPLLNVPIIDLEPRDPLRGTAPALVQLPGDSPAVTLVLTIDDRLRGAVYDVEIARADGSVSYRGAGLRRTSEGTATLTAPVELFGRDVARVTLLRAGTRTVVATYRVRVANTK
jgi:hypothetical protein